MKWVFGEKEFRENTTGLFCVKQLLIVEDTKISILKQMAMNLGKN